ncbi:PAAR-like domain-containing protein [Sorangium sp. So ce448]|uniref:PAAR-like domain-containing protein n=1 Tax=Sorangium sp. So ce448 TaxID=3133314 RepID=UPI003F61DB81
MMPAGSKGGGTCMGMPDVCKVPAPPAPPIPIPFPNMAMVSNATATSTKVMIENKHAVVEMSEIPASTGDQAGTAGGVVSGTVAQKVVFKRGSSKVKIEGKGAVYLTAQTAHNGASANMPAGLHDSPSQAKVLVAP